MPGWRLGAITAGEAVMAEIAKVLDCVQISPVRAGQAAVTWGIDGIRDWREANRAEINARAALFRDAMAPLNDWRVLAAAPISPMSPTRSRTCRRRMWCALWCRSAASSPCPAPISDRARSGTYASPSPMWPPTGSAR